MLVCLAAYVCVKVGNKVEEKNNCSWCRIEHSMTLCCIRVFTFTCCRCWTHKMLLFSIQIHFVFSLLFFPLYSFSVWIRTSCTFLVQWFTWSMMVFLRFICLSFMCISFRSIPMQCMLASTLYSLLSTLFWNSVSTDCQQKFRKKKHFFGCHICNVCYLRLKKLKKANIMKWLQARIFKCDTWFRLFYKKINLHALKSKLLIWRNKTFCLILKCFMTPPVHHFTYFIVNDHASNRIMSNTKSKHFIRRNHYDCMPNEIWK